MADFQAGIGPFLGVFLASQGWQNGKIGTVMTLGGVAGMVMTAPAGALVDATTKKRALVAATAILTIAASLTVLITQTFWAVSLSQIATAMAGAAILPAVGGITLGMFGQNGFGRQNGRNQAINHAGNIVGAALSGVVGWKFGLPAVFWLSVAFGIAAIISVALLPEASIDHRVARGLADGADAPGARGLRVLYESRALLVLSVSLLVFHLGNAAMLPLLGIELSENLQRDPASTVAITVVVAQAVMVVVSIVAMRSTSLRGCWVILLVSFAALPLRGFVAAVLHTPWAVYPVQCLDGIGAGLQSVAVPTLVAKMLNGTGRVNVGQGAVMTAQGIGAALSPALGGWLSQELGYPATFSILGGIASVSIGLWVIFRRSLIQG